MVVGPVLLAASSTVLGPPWLAVVVYFVALGHYGARSGARLL